MKLHAYIEDVFKLIGLFICIFCGLQADCEDIRVREDNDLPSDAKPLFVSLGSSCEMAMNLRENQLRTVAFPFDWLLTLNHERFLSLLDDDFQFFLDENYFIRHPTQTYIAENCFYEIEFRHDWPFKDLRFDLLRYIQHIEEIKTKYQRRVERFRQLRQYKGKVFFIRSAFDYIGNENTYWGDFHTSKTHARIVERQAEELKLVLRRYFPVLDFKLVIVNHAETSVPAIEETEELMEFKIRISLKSEDYTAMFKNLIERASSCF